MADLLKDIKGTIAKVREDLAHAETEAQRHANIVHGLQLTLSLLSEAQGLQEYLPKLREEVRQLEAKHGALEKASEKSAAELNRLDRDHENRARQLTRSDLMVDRGYGK